MLFKISFLTALLFSAIYPLSFWISAHDPLKNNFHRFHLGLSCFVLGVTTIVYGTSPMATTDHLISMLIWIIALLLVTAISWHKVSVNPIALTVIFVIGLITINKILNSWIPVSPVGVLMLTLGGMIFCAALFAMNLGHWYLNVHGLPLNHLKRAVYVFWSLVAVRAIFDLCFMFQPVIFVHAEVPNIAMFMLSIEGFLIILAILFGTIFPLICLYFVKGTLDVKSTQSATGILYAILCGVVIGDITYKYYFFKYGIIL